MNKRCIHRYLINTSIVFLSIIGLHSCSFPDDFIEPQSTYKESVSIGDNMYQVEADILSTFDISDPSRIILIDEKRLNSRAESLVSFGGVLFIGSGRSLLSYIINAEGIPIRDNIVSVNTFSPEQTECDLLSIDNNVAFVAFLDHTNQNNNCRRITNNNTIQIYDIATLTTPVLLSSIVLMDLKDIATEPTLLFVSDGSNGFKIYDTSDTQNLVELYHFADIESTDVVLNEGMLIVGGPSELRQYDYSDISDIRVISRIEL